MLIALIEEFPNYEVDTEGRVFALPNVQHFKGRWGWQERRTKRKQLSDFNSGGYRQVSLCKDGEKFRKSVHRLVAKAFIPNPDNMPEVNHLNEIRSDNRVENLEWTDRSGNALHSSHKFRGSKSPVAILNEEDIAEIKILIRNGHNQMQIGGWFGVHHSTISKIKTGVNWKHVD